VRERDRGGERKFEGERKREREREREREIKGERGRYRCIHKERRIHILLLMPCGNNILYSIYVFLSMFFFFL